MKLARHALALAVIVASSSAFALDQLSDSTMSDTTGQAGLTISTILPAGGVNGTLVYTDTNGGTGGPAAFATSNPNPGDVLAAFNLTGKTTATIDAGATAGGAANVLIDITTPASGLTTKITSLQACATSNDPLGVCSAASNILALPAGGLAISLNNLDMQIMLGASTGVGGQHFITSVLPAAFNMQFGTSAVTGAAPQFSLLDPNNYTSTVTAGGIGVSELLIGQSAIATTTIDACTSAGAVTTGVCTAAQTGGLSGLLIQSNAQLNINAYNVTFGNVGTTSPTAAIGNVAVYGLAMAGTTVMISGH